MTFISYQPRQNSHPNRLTVVVQYLPVSSFQQPVAKTSFQRWSTGQLCKKKIHGVFQIPPLQGDGGARRRRRFSHFHPTKPRNRARLRWATVVTRVPTGRIKNPLAKHATGRVHASLGSQPQPMSGKEPINEATENTAMKPPFTLSF